MLLRSLAGSQGTGSRSPGSVGTKDNQGHAYFEDSGDPKNGFSGAMNNHWAALFGVKPTGNSSFPPVFVTCDKVIGKVALSITDQVIDHNIVVKALTLVGKFSGPRPDIDSVRIFVSRRWNIKGKVEVSALPWGFFSFSFSCTEDIPTILCGGPWIMGRSSLTLKKCDGMMKE
ncbi:hypothetical protein SUGI_0539270 [Cryptomeria japonica]|nr:hypothetical protein SUGI_0539270 [Cryptomeria japonica]